LSVKLKTSLHNAALVVASLLILFIILELVVRFVSPQYSYYPRYIYISDEHTGYRLRPDFRGQHDHEDYIVDYDIGPNGFRGPAHYDKKKPGYRIVALGDSYTFGLGVPFEDTYLSLLEDKSRVEIINAGVPGYSTIHELNLYTFYAGYYDHDLVTLLFYDNDPDGNMEGISRNVIDGYLVPTGSNHRSIQFLITYLSDVSQLAHLIAETVKKSSFLYGKIRDETRADYEPALKAKIDKTAKLLIVDSV
jgi:hypothetical protein